ncbi:MAG: Ribosomal RNA small subunit methyltransferase H [Eubacteriales bacterium SKADARSKE-1]|nr:Ribosomal RNA small subunit methyltransferase H [Eubacteriales bacterium SKADARSKE-1]
MKFEHKPVLLKETIEALDIKPDGVYVDGTAGGGGHSEAILTRLTTGKLISIDQDPDAILALKDRLSKYSNSIIIQENFSNMSDIIKSLSMDAVDGVLLDIGVSSHQLDTPSRGFSYHNDAPLDMRMSKTGLSAYDVVNKMPEHDIANIINNYGEEKFARSIARYILKYRKEMPIKTTLELAEIVKESVPAKFRREGHPARKTFQALRIFVNSELDVLSSGLDSAFGILKSEGRLAVITFHSLEDRIVKKRMNKWCQGCICPPDFPVCVCGNKPEAKLINKKAIEPTAEEIEQNKRSRSAKLRVCAKL